MKEQEGNQRVRNFLLVILILIVLTLAVVEIMRYRDEYKHKRGEGYFYSRENNVVAYRGEIFEEQLKTRTQIVNEMPKTSMQFYETKYDFGTVSKGEIVKHAFRFKNTGLNPLMIAKTDVSCGCTVPEFPMDQISPGSEAEIIIVFNSGTNKTTGVEEKNILIHANTNPEAIAITIIAHVQ
jgi:Protein of unknown function (DUF1573)